MRTVTLLTYSACSASLPELPEVKLQKRAPTPKLSENKCLLPSSQRRPHAMGVGTAKERKASQKAGAIGGAACKLQRRAPRLLCARFPFLRPFTCPRGQGCSSTPSNLNQGVLISRIGFGALGVGAASLTVGRTPLFNRQCFGQAIHSTQNQL